jgi:hypothetical protein
MTTGALIFAFDNESTDYVSMASWSARNIRRWLNIPVAVVTDASARDPRVSGFDQVIPATAASGGTRWFEDYQATVTWHNAGRTDAYSLTPWDRTLVLDADYVVASDQLKAVLNSNQEFLAHAAAYDITGTNNFAGLNDYGEYHMPMTWATVMMFRRGAHAELIFDCMQMIRANWRQTLEYKSIPWSLASVTPEHTVTRTAKDCYRIDYVDHEKRPRWTMIKNQDFHAMGKSHLEKIIEAD